MDVSEYLTDYTEQIINQTHNALHHFLIRNSAHIRTRRDEQECLLATIGIMIGALASVRRDIEEEIGGAKTHEEQCRP